MRLTVAITIVALTLGGNLRLIAGQTETADASRLCGRIASQLHQPDNAALRYCAALRQDPHNAAALNGLGIVLAQRKMYGDAVTAYKLALRLHSHRAEIEKNLGIAYVQTGNFHAAAQALRESVALNGADAQARTLLGMALYGARDYAAAAGQLAIAAKAGPHNTKLLFVLAECYLLSHQPQQTLQVFEKIEEQQPNSAAAYMLLGQALDGLRRYDQAILEFKKAAAAAPTAPNVHFILGYLYWKRRKFDRAEAEFRQELAGNPTNAEARAYLGDIRYRRGDWEPARQLLAQALSDGCGIRLIYLDLGIIDARSRHYAVAVRELHKAVALDPTQTDAHYRLAIAYKGLGNTAAMNKELETIKEMEAENRAVVQQHVLGRP